jgi:hypothetical protein
VIVAACGGVGTDSWRKCGMGFGEGRGLAGHHSSICVLGAMRFGEEDVWVV